MNRAKALLLSRYQMPTVIGSLVITKTFPDNNSSYYFGLETLHLPSYEKVIL